METRAMILIALMGLPRMLDEIVTRLIDDDPGLRIVARLAGDADLDDAFAVAHADVVICAAPEAAVRDRWRASLQRRPPRAVLNLGVDARHGSALALRTVEHALGPVSGHQLIAALHVMAANHAET